MKRPAITVKEEPPLCRHIVFPCPGAMGKGILVQPTLWGNLCLGPTAHDFSDKNRRTSIHDEASRGETKVREGGRTDRGALTTRPPRGCARWGSPSQARPWLC